MALTSCLGLLTLQVGTAIVAALFFTLAGAMFAANLFDYHKPDEDEWFPYNLFLMSTFAIGLATAGALIFGSSYSQNRRLAIAALILTTALIGFWFILCVFSFLSFRDQVEVICIETRCPESFWLSSLPYRRFQIPPEQLAADERRRTCRPRPPTRIPRNLDAVAVNGVDFFVKSKDKFKILNSSEDKSEVSLRERMLLTVNTTFNKNGMLQRITEGERRIKPKNDSNTGLVLSVDIKPLLPTSEVHIGREKRRKNEIEDELDIVLSRPSHNISDGVNGNTSYVRKQRKATTYSTVRPYQYWRPTPERLEDVDDEERKTNKPPTKVTRSPKKKEEEPSRFYFGTPMIAAIALFFINLLFLLFSALVMYSWAHEIDWTDYYYEEDPEVIVEEVVVEE